MSFPYLGIVTLMGNDMADAIRDELREELIRAYGSLEAAAVAVGIPYKTLYRALTTRGKDRSQSVKLDLVIDIADRLASDGFATFSTIYDSARNRFDLVANDSINEFPAGDDTDYDHA